MCPAECSTVTPATLPPPPHLYLSPSPTHILPLTQVDALLAEARVGHSSSLSRHVHQLRAVLAAIPQQEVDGSVAAGFLQAVGASPEVCAPAQLGGG